MKSQDSFASATNSEDELLTARAAEGEELKPIEG